MKYLNRWMLFTAINRKNSVIVLRWVARIWSIASVGLLCSFLVGEGLPPLTVQTVMFPFGIMFGLILAWRFERIGGLLAVACMLLFYILEYIGHGIFPKGKAFILIAAPGVIFLCYGFLIKMNDAIAKK